MAVDIYQELLAINEKLASIQSRLAGIEAQLAPKTKLAPVTYFRDSLLWDKALASRPALTLINPGSGPGTAQSSTYVGLVAKAKAAGAKVLGYVYTDYGARALADVKADIDKHIAWYGVDGIFLDETSNVAAAVPYYVDLSAYLRGKGRMVVLNPGTKTIEEYAGLADYIMNAETDVPRYVARTAATWESKYPGKFWHCVHTCSAADMPMVVHLAKARGAGLLYVTDDVMANPYDRLPAYWDALTAELAR
jgi:hypothetical protein